MPETFDIGYVHVRKPISESQIEGVFECADNCPHPLHRHVCDVAGCEQTFATMREVIEHERICQLTDSGRDARA